MMCGHLTLRYINTLSARQRTFFAFPFVFVHLFIGFFYQLRIGDIRFCHTIAKGETKPGADICIELCRTVILNVLQGTDRIDKLSFIIIPIQEQDEFIAALSGGYTAF